MSDFTVIFEENSANFSTNFAESPANFTPDIGETTILGDHNILINRDANNQHPISAVTGLQSALDSKADEEDIPTKTSQLENDSGFLTEHQSLAEYRKSASQDIIDAGKQSTLVSGTNIKTVNGQSILGSGNLTISVTDETTTLESELYTYAPIGVLQTEGGRAISSTNPKKVAGAGDTLKDVFNAVFGEPTDSNPTINQSGTTFTKSGQTGTTSVSGAEIGQSISAQTGTVTFNVNTTATCSYGLKAGSNDTYSKVSGTTFNYPVKTRTINSNNYKVRIKYPPLNGCTLSVTAGTLVLNDTTNRYLYCNLDNSNKVTVSISISACTSTASTITRFGQLEADVEFDVATYSGVIVDNFWTYLKNSYTATGKSHSAITGVKSTAYSITAGTRYAYSKVTSSATAPTSSLTKQAAESTFSSSGADFNYSTGDYIYMYRTSTGRTVQTYVLGQWANVNFTEMPATTITQANGATCTYYPYKVGPMEATGSAKYRV